MLINRRRISLHDSPFIVAEISSNHNQDIDTALKLVKKAKECGCDAVKFQTYKPESLTLDSELLELYKKTYLPFSWHKKLFKLARDIDIIPFSSVFCLEGLKLLEELNCSAYKIASFEIKHLPLLWEVKKTGKPIIFSSGMAEFSDLNFINTQFSGINTAVLRCVSNYPAKAEDFNLKTIRDMRSQFPFEVGISDHTLDIGISCTAVALGASIVEKHFTLKRNGGMDDEFSIEPDEMKVFVDNIRKAWEAKGEVKYNKIGNEYYQRSLYAIKDIKSGESFTESNIGVLRPNRGMSPLSYYTALKNKAHKSFKKGEAIRCI